MELIRDAKSIEVNRAHDFDVILAVLNYNISICRSYLHALKSGAHMYAITDEFLDLSNLK